MENKDILISGAGIAGTALAFWLKKFGFNPTIVEIAPQIREGGYAIDFMGAGFDVAEKMGLVPALEKADINISNLVFVDKNDREMGRMNYRKIKKLMNNRALTLLRSDLARVIYENLDRDIEFIFNDSIQELKEVGGKVEVTFKNAPSRTFDLVVGADGLHSRVRKLAFGKEDQFEVYCGYYTSSFTVSEFSYEGRAFSMYNIPGRQVAVYSYGENSTATFFIFASPEKLDYSHHDVDRQKQLLQNAFEDAGWKCPELLSGMDTAPDFYFDSVSQIKMKNWAKGRITLVGDACDCPSLLSGKGSTLAMVGAYILAGELKRAGGNYAVAFERYEGLFKPFMEKKQQSAKSFAKSFVPKSKFGIWVRNQALKLLSISFVSRLALNQFKDKGLELEEY